MGRIHTLPDSLINKIAAGEVVERPASVVKELCENSIDAGATSIRVKLAAGGLSSITVIDDGIGMSREDAQACLGRHATSKLRDLDGLFNIETMGFRGEAVPAIASVSRFTLTTTEAGAPVGTKLFTPGGVDVRFDDASPSPGTRIDVEDLFFNTPARRKFMRREATELVHCQEAVIRLALAHPDIGFFVEHEGRALLTAPASADPRERIAAALGPEVHPHLLEIREKRLGLEVHGFVASPEFTLPNARGLYTLVNRRYIRDRGVNYAVQRAYQEALPSGRQPVAVIHIDLDPHDVDVNVHPQKLEVRFVDSRSVQDALNTAISTALKAAPWRQRQGNEADLPLQGAYYAQAVERFLTRAQEPSGLFEPAAESPGFGQARPGINQAPPPRYFSQVRFIGELAGRLWVCEGAGGTLLVIDPHAVRERLALHQLQQPGSTAQRTLFTATVELKPAEVERITALQPQLEALGVEAEAFGPTTVAIKALPVSCEQPEALLVDLLGDLPRAHQVLAHHAALAHRSVSASEARALLTALDGVDFSADCLHPDVIVHEVPLLSLARD
ncbi:MAG: DNA mismatch repair endonuclease MutL [Archangiaceae bacterium]|nr:DNA mismatch repair endonuclease MutL [Archangiaceae bacterium]